jgi:hypothetical protein
LYQIRRASFFHKKYHVFFVRTSPFTLTIRPDADEEIYIFEQAPRASHSFSQEDEGSALLLLPVPSFVSIVLIELITFHAQI